MLRSRPLLLLAVLLAALTAASSTAAATASSSTRAYVATAASPVALPAIGTVGVPLVLTNCGACADGTTSTTSTLPFASAEVQLPVGVVLGAQPTVANQGWSAVVAADARSVLFVSTTRGKTTAVQPGASLRLALPVSASSVTGPATFATAVKQSNDFSGTGNDFRRIGPDPVVLLTRAQVPDRIEFAQGPSTVQVSPSTASGNTVPVLVMCPAPQVRVVDASGATITTLPPTAVTLRSSRDGATGGAGLVLDGASTPPATGGEVAQTTSGGVATFGGAQQADVSCATGLRATVLGTGYALHASAVIDGRSFTATAQDGFSVLPVYALCGDSCTSGPLSGDGTTAQVFASGGSGAPDPLTFSVGLGPWEFEAACDPDPGAGGINPYRQAVTVDLADHDKSVQLSWSKQAVQWATNNGASQWQVCLAAVYPFPAVDGQATQVGDGWYVGRLLPCSDPAATGPCLSSLGRSGGRQTAVVSIPDVEGDPRMI